MECVYSKLQAAPQCVTLALRLPRADLILLAGAVEGHFNQNG